MIEDETQCDAELEEDLKHCGEDGHLLFVASERMRTGIDTKLGWEESPGSSDLSTHQWPFLNRRLPASNSGKCIFPKPLYSLFKVLAAPRAVYNSARDFCKACAQI